MANAVGAERLPDRSTRVGHSCGVTTEGTVYYWGLNSNGELGNLARVGPV